MDDASEFLSAALAAPTAAPTLAFDPASTPGRMAVHPNDPRRLSCLRLLGYAPGADAPSVVGTGVLIRPDIILTAGHNLFDPDSMVYGTDRAGGYAGWIRVDSPWLPTPPELAYASRIVTTNGWINDRTRAFDLGVVKLNGPLPAPTHPMKPTACDWSAGDGPDVYAYGFPGPAMELEVSPGDLIGFTEGLAFYVAETEGGFSGGPLILSDEGRYLLAGLHRAGRGEAGFPDGCNGVVFTQDMLDWIAAAEGVL